MSILEFTIRGILVLCAGMVTGFFLLTVLIGGVILLGWGQS